MTVGHAYPTSAHERAAVAIADYFAAVDDVDAVLPTNSCARGKATSDSCLDMQVIVPTAVVERVDTDFRAFATEDEAVAALIAAGRFSDLHLDVTDGIVEPGVIDEEGIDWFEVSVGNTFVYSFPLFTRGSGFESLGARWLPYYGDDLRRERLEAARWFVLDNNLARIPWFIERELYFQAFDRFYRAFQASCSGSTSRAAHTRSPTTSGSGSRSPTISGCLSSTTSCRGCWSSIGSTAERSTRRRSSSQTLPSGTSCHNRRPLRPTSSGQHRGRTPARGRRSPENLDVSRTAHRARK